MKDLFEWNGSGRCDGTVSRQRIGTLENDGSRNCEDTGIGPPTQTNHNEAFRHQDSCQGFHNGLPQQATEKGPLAEPVGGKNSWADKPVRDCSHVYSDGNAVNSLFDTREEKIAAMNIIAILAYSFNVRILVQQVMTTHVHLIVSGEAVEREGFARELKRRLMLWASWKKHSVHSGILVGNDEIRTERELMNKFMYVYRNAIAAGYPGMPWDYIGGPGNIFFIDHNQVNGKPVSELSKTERREMLHSKKIPPEGWLHNDEGLVLPHSYVDWRRVEMLFRSPKVFLAFLHQSKNIESAIDLECSKEYVRTVSEKELRATCKKMCLNMFGKATLSRASLEERIAVAQRAWGDRCTYSLSALSRVTLVPKSVLESIFCAKR